MAKKKDNTNLTELLLESVGQPDPMLHMLEWLCSALMEAEVSAKLGAEKNEHNTERVSSRSGYRLRCLDTRMGTMYFMIPKVRSGGYIPFFVTERKRSEAALVQIVQGVSTRKMDKPAKDLDIEKLFRLQVSEMTKGLNDQMEAFRHRPLTEVYPILWVDALYEKVRFDRRVIRMAIRLVCGVNQEGRREVLAIERMKRMEKCSAVSKRVA